MQNLQNLVRVKEIKLEQGEGRMPLPKATVHSFKEANEMLKKWAENLSDNDRGIFKTDFEVLFKNGDKYTGTYELQKEDLKLTDRNWLQNHMISDFKFSNGLSTSKEVPDFAKNYYTNLLNNVTLECYTDAKEFLTSVDWEGSDIGAIRKFEDGAF